MTEDDPLYDAPEMAGRNGQRHTVSLDTPPTRAQMATKLQEIAAVLNAQSIGLLDLQKRLSDLEAKFRVS